MVSAVPAVEAVESVATALLGFVLAFSSRRDHCAGARDRFGHV